MLEGDSIVYGEIFTGSIIVISGGIDTEASTSMMFKIKVY